MRFLFPKTRFVGSVSIASQIDKISSEARELSHSFWNGESDERHAEEAFDVVQAAETFLRQLEERKGPGWLEDQFQTHIRKLTERGSYDCG